jgi:hypothetical protein
MPEVTAYQRFQSAAGGFDWFMLPFDKRVRCLGPETRAHLVRRAADPEISDVFVFSHGWNNDWNVATGRYRDFIDGYLELRRTSPLPIDRPLRPLLVGVFWPSTALVFGSERGEAIAAGPDPQSDRLLDVAQLGAEVAALADAVDDAHVERLYALSEKDELTADEGRELARILAPVLGGADDEDPADRDTTVDPDAMVDVWRRLPSTEVLIHGAPTQEDPRAVAARLDDFGLDPPANPSPGDGAPVAAGGLGKLDPRQAVRLATVQLMKDRAGTVGSYGLGAFLAELLEASSQTRPRVHLVGHSYGAKVCLSALCHPSAIARPVDSLLLLQPAVSHRCFARDERGTGGYAHAPSERVDQPILSTFSRHDVPLNLFFPFAARRRADRDEARIAGSQPSRYAALGAVGPRGLGEAAQLVPVRLPGAPDGGRYDLGPDAPGVYGIDASATIGGHGKIDNPSTHWALDNLVAADRGAR